MKKDEDENMNKERGKNNKSIKVMKKLWEKNFMTVKTKVYTFIILNLVIYIS